MTFVRPPIHDQDPADFQKLAQHIGHEIDVVTYGKLHTVNVAVECLNCSTVLVDADRYPKSDPVPDTEYDYYDPEGPGYQNEWTTPSRDVAEPRTAEPIGYDPRPWYSLDEANAYRDGYDDAVEKAEAAALPSEQAGGIDDVPPEAIEWARELVRQWGDAQIVRASLADQNHDALPSEQAEIDVGLLTTAIHVADPIVDAGGVGHTPMCEERAGRIAAAYISEVHKRRLATDPTSGRPCGCGDDRTCPACQNCPECGGTGGVYVGEAEHDVCGTCGGSGRTDPTSGAPSE